MTGYSYITDTGIVSADTADILDVVQREWRASLGQKLNVAAATPQGTMIAGEAIARTSTMKTNVELANQMNPQFSYGPFLDANCAFLGIERGSNKSTKVTAAESVGDPATRIQKGSRVQSPGGEVFITTEDIEIGVTGVAATNLVSVAFGDIPVEVGDMRIVDGTIGWGAVTILSTSTITPGVLALTNAQLKNQRSRRLASLGRSGTEAVWAEVLAVDNVSSVKVVENNTGAVGTVQGVQFTLPGAAWVCVAGTPNQQAVADALYAAHMMSCPWDYGTNAGVPVNPPNGVAVVDPITGLTYSVKWTTPFQFDTYIKATIANGTSAASPIQGVGNAIINYANGNIEGEEGFVVGASVSGYELAGAVSRTLPGLYVRSILVACVPAGSAPPAAGAYTSEFIMSPFGQANIAIGNIQVITV